MEKTNRIKSKIFENIFSNWRRMFRRRRRGIEFIHGARGARRIIVQITFNRFTIHAGTHSRLTQHPMTLVVLVVQSRGALRCRSCKGPRLAGCYNWQTTTTSSPRWLYYYSIDSHFVVWAVRECGWNVMIYQLACSTGALRAALPLPMCTRISTSSERERALPFHEFMNENLYFAARGLSGSAHANNVTKTVGIRQRVRCGKGQRSNNTIYI